MSGVVRRQSRSRCSPDASHRPARRHDGLKRRPFDRIIAHFADQPTTRMPIYEYQCQKCGHHLEALQKISDKPLRECPECGKHQLKRLMSAPLFRLAGSGWYETDFKSDKENKRNLVGDKGESEGSAESKPEAKTEAKTEAKVEAKKEPAEKKASRTMVTRPAIKKSGAKAKPAARKAAKKPGKR